ncbi:hypothetical protein CONLIGDRAFT_636270 [Coniochaeta ligniaria NRRL 30616]|uniref:Integral membrane bound transporter domain-containing protein n=1 Tax=Coniochaeta ligniaria NRRL 30616 TaxID=1408157 RepID=A0A1J7IBW7_9PEZI|nr:hypothetical protein CONLIGDRAFT_636270 [Coniochaeta ligniaria NRRL 30616]
MSSVPSHEEGLFRVSTGHSHRRSRAGSSFSRLRRRLTFDVNTKTPHPPVFEEDEDEEVRPPLSRSRPGSQWALHEVTQLIDGDEYDQETYGLIEFRDGFFDAAFTKPRPLDREELDRRAQETLPVALQKQHPLSLEAFFPKQWRSIKDVAIRVFTTRGGVKLAKTFTGVFAAYVLCLVPSIRAWLGTYSYIMVISTIINHPGRTIGAQLDGCVSTILGTLTGLGWGAFGLWLSTSTMAAKIGYGAILAVFLGVYIFIIAAIRSYFIRLFQFVICAGIAVCYTVLSEVSNEQVRWEKLLNYGIPWCLGQGLCLVVCLLFFPDAGARPLAVSLDNAFAAMLDGLDEKKAQLTLTRRRLAQTFVNVSQMYRDLVIDFSMTLFDPKDVFELRNLMQAVVRSLLALRPRPAVFNLHDVADGRVPPKKSNNAQDIEAPVELDNITLDEELAGVLSLPHLQGGRTPAEEAIHLVSHNLEDPTSRLIHRMKHALRACHAVLMDRSGYRKYLGPGEDVDSDLLGALVKLRKVMHKFDAAEDALLEGEEMAATFVQEVVEVFAYCRPIRQAAKAIEAVLVKVMEMEQRRPTWPRIYAPSYPWRKALNRTNAQVRHDRGGVTAGSYYRSFDDISHLIDKIKSSVHNPNPDLAPQEPELFTSRTVASDRSRFEEKAEEGPPLKKSTFRYGAWKILHRLQGFEMRFALKNVIVTVLLAMPAWLNESREWWNKYSSWWAVVMAWMMMHPRVGGNLQDLVTRAFMGLLGAVWAGAGYAAGQGSPYVMGVFAAIYLLPMLYRFTQSSHPRSGLVGCLSFTAISLTLMIDSGSPVTITISRGLAFVVGVVAAILINWILWPFVARHELRKAVSAMLFFLSIIYRSIVAKYIYYEQGNKPTAEDIHRSEILEGRLREGFVRVRQLMGLTRHEIRLRGPFNPLHYSALVNGCEHFFELLVAVRESALYFDPKFARDNEEAMSVLLNYRRDAVASILTNLYILAGALRANRKVPKYLPSAALARKRLMDKMIELENEYETDRNRETRQLGERKKWVQIYSYSYNESLTGCVAQLEELERYTKLIVGEQGFNDDDDSESWDERE